jgi:hypothetical protein
MADDDGNETPPPPPSAGLDRDTLKSLIREVLDEDVPGKVEDQGDDGDRPATVRDLEAWAEKITREAAEVIKKAAPRPKAAHKKDTGSTDTAASGSAAGGAGDSGGDHNVEPSPAPPPVGTGFDKFQKSMRKLLVGE